jgi:hypothetical protein
LQILRAILEKQVTKPERSAKKHSGPVDFILLPFHFLGVTSRATLLDTTSRISLRFFTESYAASREP